MHALVVSRAVSDATVLEATGWSVKIRSQQPMQQIYLALKEMSP